MARKSYILFKRPTRATLDKAKKAGLTWPEYKQKHKNFDGIFYAQFWNDATSKYSTAKTTECRTINAATAWCDNELITGGYRAFGASSETFGAYADGFWTIDPPSAYVKHRTANNNSISVAYAKNQQSLLENYILPFFKDMKIKRITAADVEDFVNKLKADNPQQSAVYRNRILGTLRVMLNEAFRTGKMHHKPVQVAFANEHADRVSRDAIRGWYKMNELVLLFHPQNMALWTDRVHYVFALIAAATGARWSEIVALRAMDFDGDALFIRRAFNKASQVFKETKASASTRKLFLSAYLVETVGRHVAKVGDGLLFADETKRDVPFDYSKSLEALHDTLGRAGIDWKGRRLGYHSFRHSIETICSNAGVSSEALKVYTGRSRGAGSEVGYRHFTEKAAFNGVLEYQKSFLEIDVSQLVSHKKTKLLTLKE